MSNLNELSKKTLGSYAKKAVISVTDKTLSTGKAHSRNDKDWHKDLGKIDKRIKGINRATDKLTKEDTIKDMIGSIVNKDYVSAQASFEEAMLSKIDDILASERVKVAAKVYEDLDEEDLDEEDLDEEDLDEVEDLEELSKKTLGSYVKKAGGLGMNSIGAHALSSNKTEKSMKKLYKRAKGIERAADKLTK